MNSASYAVLFIAAEETKI